MSTRRGFLGATAAALALREGSGSTSEPRAWTVGKPMVTYWAGPGFPSGNAPLTDSDARQLREGGWNWVWSSEATLPIVERHDLRALLTDPLLTPKSLDGPQKKAALEALVDRVKGQPGMYAYFLNDEPGASHFPEVGRLVAFLRERDPAHLPYVNLFPIGATNEQLGTDGDFTSAYQAYLDRFVEVVKPSLLSYDHYQFRVAGDTPHYFQNLAMVRKKALDAGLPFMNIVQACTWSPVFRAPNQSEMRYLYYTTLAYGGQGLSQYVYAHPGHSPGIATLDGKPTHVYEWLKPLNRDFAAIAEQLQPLRSVGAYHLGMLPPGTVGPPADFPFTLETPPPPMELKGWERVRGVLLGAFGRAKGSEKPTHVVVVNLDYEAETILGLRGPRDLEVFDAVSGKWSSGGGKKAELRLSGGGGALIRLRRR
jgi:hypothetical protein